MKRIISKLMMASAALAIGMALMPLSASAKKPSSYVTVNCDGGDKVQEVIDKAPPWVPLHINIAGVCKEEINIERDDVTLEGATPNASINPDTGVGVFVVGGQRIVIYHLIVSGPEAALATDSAYVALNDVTLEGSQYNGIDAVLGSNILLENSRVRNNQGGGVLIENGGTLGIFNTVVSGNSRDGISLNKNTAANIHDTELSDNGGAGIRIGDNSTAHVKDATVISGNNGHGISVVQHADVRVFSDPIISENGQSGIFLARDSGAELVGPVTIFGNGDIAVRCNDDESSIVIHDYTNVGQDVFCTGF